LREDASHKSLAERSESDTKKRRVKENASPEVMEQPKPSKEDAIESEPTTSHPPSNENSKRFFRRASTGLSSLRGGVLAKALKKERLSVTKDSSSVTKDPWSVPSEEEPQTESSIPRQPPSLSILNSVSQKKDIPLSRFPSSNMGLDKGTSSNKKSSQNPSSLSNAKSTSSFWTKSSRSRRATETVDDAETRDDQSYATSIASRVTSKTVLTQIEPGQTSLDVNDHSEASVLSETLHTEASLSQATKPSAQVLVSKAKSTRSAESSKAKVVPVPTGATSQISFPSSDNLDKLVKSLGGVSGLTKEDDKESEKESERQPVFFDGMDVVQDRTKVASDVHYDEDEDAAQERERVARKVIELNSEEIRRRAERALRSKMTKAKLKDLAAEKKQTINDFTLGAATSLSHKSAPSGSIRSTILAGRPATLAKSSLSGGQGTTDIKEDPLVSKLAKGCLKQETELASGDDITGKDLIRRADSPDAEKVSLGKEQNTFLSDETPRTKGGANLFRFRSSGSGSHKRQEKAKSISTRPDAKGIFARGSKDSEAQTKVKSDGTQVASDRDQSSSTSDMNPREAES
jgi:hypothetical protein